MPYCHLYYHLVWFTRDGQPLLKPATEAMIHHLVRTKAMSLGATVYALNGMADHIHIVAAVPPTISIDNFVGQLKVASAARYNQPHPVSSTFGWQGDYGVISFDGKRLAHFVEYVEQQKERHAQNNLIPLLERVSGDAGNLVREAEAEYDLDQEEWMREMMSEV